MTIALQLLLQVVLIVINAFFAATEIAVISLNANKLRKLEEEGDKLAPRLLKMVEEPAGFLSTIQIGITLAGFLASAFAADSFSEYLVRWFWFTLLERLYWHKLHIRNFGVSLQGKLCGLAFFLIIDVSLLKRIGYNGN